MKEKKLERERDTTKLLQVTVQGGCLMEIYGSREAFGVTRYVIVSTRRRTIVNNLAVMFLRHIMTPSLVSLGMFSLAVTYLFAV